MGGNDEATGIDIGDHPGKRGRVQPEDGAAVGPEISDFTEPEVDFFRRFGRSGAKQEQVDLPDFFLLGEDETDFRGQDEMDVVGRRGEFPGKARRPEVSAFSTGKSRFRPVQAPS